MANPLTLFQARIRFVDADGRLTPEALRSFAALLERVGGVVGPSITDLSTAEDEDSGLEDMRAEQAKHNDAADMLPPVVFLPPDDDMTPPVVFPEFTDPLHPIPQEHVSYEAVLTELAGLREEVAALRSQVDGILQGTDL